MDLVSPKAANEVGRVLAAKQTSDAAADRWQKIATVAKLELSLFNQPGRPTSKPPPPRAVPPLLPTSSPSQFGSELRAGDVWLQMWPVTCPLSPAHVQASASILEHHVVSAVESVPCVLYGFVIKALRMPPNGKEAFEVASTSGKFQPW